MKYLSTVFRSEAKLILGMSTIVIGLTQFSSISSSQEYRKYTTGEIGIEPKTYFTGSAQVASQARFLHNVRQLIEFAPKGNNAGELSGAGTIVAVWDGGLVQATHQDFRKGQVLIKDPKHKPNQTPNPIEMTLSDHATHVAGTIAGNGQGRPDAKGMASGATILSFDYNNDIAEMRAQAKAGPGILVSNHSYGFYAGWSDVCSERVTGGKKRIVWVWTGTAQSAQDEIFGQYNETSSELDKLALENPNWTQVVSAGNARSPLLDPHSAQMEIATIEDYDWIANYDLSFSGTHYSALVSGNPCMVKKVLSQSRKSNRWKGGFDTLSGGGATAKNVITVGAMVDPRVPYDPVKRVFLPIPDNEIQTTIFSSWGPTDDGRVKPDVIANGDGIVAPAIPEKCSAAACKPSAVLTNNKNYAQMSGTSMATPVVSGILSLLNELSARIRSGQTLRSDEAKAILIHTARSRYAGPSYDIGWGYIQADEAGLLLLSSEPGVHLDMVNVERSQVSTIELRRVEGRPGRITIAWLDEPGIPVHGVDNSQRTLVNDVDIELIPPQARDEGVQAILPWKLDPQNPTSAAIRAQNSVDNVERIDVPNQEYHKGVWTLRITGSNWQNVSRIPVAVALWGFDIIGK